MPAIKNFFLRLEYERNTRLFKIPFTLSTVNIKKAYTIFPSFEFENTDLFLFCTSRHNFSAIAIISRGDQSLDLRERPASLAACPDINSRCKRSEIKSSGDHLW
jgi:hypothetical protein